MDIHNPFLFIFICQVMVVGCLATPVLQAAITINSNSTFRDLPNLALLGFPPGPSPAGPYIYPVRYSNVVVNFTYYWLDQYRDEMEIEAVIREATIAAGDPKLRHTAMGHGIKTWSSGYTFLVAVPTRRDPLIMTWGAWSNALIGINQFRLSYPSLEVVFRILLQDEHHGHYIPVGVGSLYAKR